MDSAAARARECGCVRVAVTRRAYDDQVMKTKTEAKPKKLKVRTISDGPPYHGKINTKLAIRTLREIMREERQEKSSAK